MTKKSTKAGSGNPIWDFFTSVKLTVVVLLLLASTSIIGTLIPQNGTDAFYIRKYGEVFFNLFRTLDIFDMYSAWWFVLLLILLAGNIVVCSIDKLNKTWKIIFPEKVTFNADRFRRMKQKESFSSASEKGDLSSLEGRFEGALGKKFNTVVKEKGASGTLIFAESGRWTRIGVYVVHLSILFMLVGAVIGSVWGYKAFVTIPEGKTVHTATLRGSNQEVDLGFDLTCNTFYISFYDTGHPEEFRSNVTINDADETVTTDIIVNDPLRYKGLSFYQSSYGTDSARNVVFKITSNDSGMAYSKSMKFGESIEMPEFGGMFTLNRFVRGYNFRGHNLGEGFVGTLVYEDSSDHGEETAESTPQSGMQKAMAAMAGTSSTGTAMASETPSTKIDPTTQTMQRVETETPKPHRHKVEIFVPVKFPTFDKMRRGRFIFEVEDYEKRYYTGLQVTKDPGVWFVYLGFVLMIVGCWVTFFMSHQQICVEVTPDKNGKYHIHLSGRANRNNQGMKLKLAKLAASLKNL